MEKEKESHKRRKLVATKIKTLSSVKKKMKVMLATELIYLVYVAATVS